MIKIYNIDDFKVRGFGKGSCNVCSAKTELFLEIRQHATMYPTLYLCKNDFRNIKDDLNTVFNAYCNNKKQDEIKTPLVTLRRELTACSVCFEQGELFIISIWQYNINLCEKDFFEFVNDFNTKYNHYLLYNK